MHDAKADGCIIDSGNLASTAAAAFLNRHGCRAAFVVSKIPPRSSERAFTLPPQERLCGRLVNQILNR
jgi:hypothetical protein